MKTIDLHILDNVMGGISKPTSSNTELTTALQGITSSLADLKSQQNNKSSSSLTQMLPLLMMAKLARQNG